MLCRCSYDKDHILQVAGRLCHLSGSGSSRVEAYLLYWPHRAGVSGRDKAQQRKDWNTRPMPDVERRSSSSSEKNSHHLPLCYGELVVFPVAEVICIERAQRRNELHSCRIKIFLSLRKSFWDICNSWSSTGRMFELKADLILGSSALPVPDDVCVSC